MKKTLLSLVIILNCYYANSQNLCNHFMEDGKTEFHAGNYTLSKKYFESAVKLKCTGAEVWLQKSNDQISTEKASKRKFVPIELYVNDYNLLLPSQATERYITVASNANWQIMLPDLLEPQEWCTVEKQGDYATIALQKNPKSEPRVFIFRIVAGYEYKVITITQKGSGPYLNLANAYIKIPASGVNDHIEKVYTNVDWYPDTPQVHDETKWPRQTPPLSTSKKDLEHISISCPENPDIYPRSFEIVVTAEKAGLESTMTAVQEGAELYVIEDEMVFPANGGRQTIKVFTNLKTLKVEPNKSFLQNFEIESITANSITIVCDKNPVSFERGGGITIKAGKLDNITIRVIQKAF